MKLKLQDIDYLTQYFHNDEDVVLKNINDKASEVAKKLIRAINNEAGKIDDKFNQIVVDELLANLDDEEIIKNIASHYVYIQKLTHSNFSENNLDADTQEYLIDQDFEDYKEENGYYNYDNTFELIDTNLKSGSELVDYALSIDHYAISDLLDSYDDIIETQIQDETDDADEAEEKIEAWNTAKTDLVKYVYNEDPNLSMIENYMGNDSAFDDIYLDIIDTIHEDVQSYGLESNYVTDLKLEHYLTDSEKNNSYLELNAYQNEFLIHNQAEILQEYLLDKYQDGALLVSTNDDLYQDLLPKTKSRSL